MHLSTLKKIYRATIVAISIFTILINGSFAAEERSGKVPNLVAARDEAVSILSDLIKIDTSNPPGNETKAAEYLKSLLDREGIPAEIFESEPGRGNLVARLKGSGKKKPLLLMGHLDVVGVERDKWSVDPFAATIKDGYVYGRGAIDDKGHLSAFFTVFLLLHRLKVPLDRDVILLAEAGEEGTPRYGIDFMIEKHWQKIECEFALNEGGWIKEENGKAQYVGISTMEKVPHPIKLIARGSSGHGSMPRLDNPITHLAAAVGKVGSWQPPMRLNETTKEFFSRLAKISPIEEATLYKNLTEPAHSADAQEKLRATNILYNSMLRTSIVPTIIKGGFRTNVIPSEAEATLDVRALPNEDIDQFVATLRELIADPSIEIMLVPGNHRPVSTPSGLQTDLFLALERAQVEVFPKAVTLPLLLTGATDSAQLRGKGVQAYGIGTLMSDSDRARIHGNDERLSIDGFGKFLEFVYHSVTNVAAATGR
ncbi:MAG: M20/M25/M40 family metallo-hydrolase [Acidobacteriota bacterium]